MAELFLKVSEAKYKDTLNKLEGQLGQLREYESELNRIADNLDRGLQGELGKSSMSALRQNQKNVKTAIEKTEKAKNRIEQYLSKMQTAQSDLTSDINAAEEEARSIFG